jgi:hypothetical protein
MASATLLAIELIVDTVQWNGRLLTRVFVTMVKGCHHMPTVRLDQLAPSASVAF